MVWSLWDACKERHDQHRCECWHGKRCIIELLPEWLRFNDEGFIYEFVDHENESQNR